MRCVSLLCFGFFSICPTPAAIIGTNTPAQSVTPERIAQLPKSERKIWQRYVARSSAQHGADQAFFQRELRKSGLSQSTAPPEQRGARGIPLDRETQWYASSEALRIADNLVSFQTPAGGWSKNVDMASQARAPGERFALGNLFHYPGKSDFDVPIDADWNYVGTFDNDATTTQLQFLAQVISASDKRTAMRYQAAFLKGLDYIFAAQYPNGGWPQVWPLQGGYHDAITYNDGAMPHILAVLNAVASGDKNYAFVPPAIRKHAQHSLDRGVQCVLATQIPVGNHLTVWCQQNDALTLKACSARNYEMPSLASGESAEIVLFLMSLKEPAPCIVTAVTRAVEWFEKTQIINVDYKRGNPNGPELVVATGQGPLWARYYEIGTDRPIFGDRDKTIHDRLDEISLERRRGYGWYRDTPREVLIRYAAWSAQLRQER